MFFFFFFLREKIYSLTFLESRIRNQGVGGATSLQQRSWEESFIASSSFWWSQAFLGCILPQFIFTSLCGCVLFCP